MLHQKLLQKENSGNYIDKLKDFSSDELETFRKQFADFKNHYKNTLFFQKLHCAMPAKNMYY